jgi:hypothetical protein
MQIRIRHPASYVGFIYMTYVNRNDFLLYLSSCRVQIEVSQKFQEEEEPQEGQVDQGFQEIRRKGSSCET